MDIDNTVNFQIISNAISFYTNKGYKNVNTDWMVPIDIVSMTKPDSVDVEKDEIKCPISNKFLVASAEQGFIKQLSDKTLKPGKYQSTTPCFRNNEIEDKYHQLYFIKTELIITDNITQENLEIIIQDAFEFFSTFFDKDLKIIKTEDARSEASYDIEYKGIELGSYGIRRINGLEWIYGTGCAEQRLRTLLIDNK